MTAELLLLIGEETCVYHNSSVWFAFPLGEWVGGLTYGKWCDGHKDMYCISLCNFRYKNCCLLWTSSDFCKTYTQKNRRNVRYCCRVLSKIGICRKGLVKFSNIVFHGSPSVPRFWNYFIWTDGLDETTCGRVINREMNYLLRGSAQRQFDKCIRVSNIIESLSWRWYIHHPFFFLCTNICFVEILPEP